MQCVVISAKEQGAVGNGLTSGGIANWLEGLRPGPLMIQGAKGSLKMGLGGAAVTSGSGLCATGVGCLAGGPVALIGASEATQGATMLWDALHGVQSEGVNPLKAASNAAFGQYGDAVYDTAALAASVGALASKVPLVLGPTDGINRAKSIFGVTVNQWDNAKYIPAIGLYVPPFVNQINSIFSSSMKVQTIEQDLQKASR
jgi:filamentous hemagglutinin